MKNFLLGRYQSVFYALKGMWILITTEHSIITQTMIALAVTFAGFYFEISSTEWILQILAIGLVLTAEGLNTAIEAMADFIHPERHPKIGLIKDIAAGAVAFAALAAIAIGLIIYLPKLV